MLSLQANLALAQTNGVMFSVGKLLTVVLYKAKLLFLNLVDNLG